MNYYNVLDIKSDATIDEIKKAYKKKAKLYHPDRHPQENKKENEEKFKLVNEAYRHLINKSEEKCIEQNYNLNDVISSIFDINNSFSTRLIFILKNNINPRHININVNCSLESLLKHKKKRIKIKYKNRYINYEIPLNQKNISKIDLYKRDIIETIILNPYPQYIIHINIKLKTIENNNT